MTAGDAFLPARAHRPGEPPTVIPACPLPSSPRKRGSIAAHCMIVLNQSCITSGKNVIDQSRIKALWFRRGENEDEASLEAREYTLSQVSEERVERLRKYTQGRLWNNAGGAGALH